jgi:N-acetyltransferase
LEEQERGESVVFATLERSSGRAIGSTRFVNIDRVNRRAEIGSTWIAPAWQRTAVNTEAKYLMLRHAFEVWKCMRVELKTDALNQRSRNAIRESERKKKARCAGTSSPGQAGSTTRFTSAFWITSGWR